MEAPNYPLLFQTPADYNPPDDGKLRGSLDYPNLNSREYYIKPVNRTPRIQPFYENLITNSHGNVILGCNNYKGREWKGSVWGFESIDDVGCVKKSGFNLQCNAFITGMRYVKDDVLLLSLDNGCLQLWSTRSEVRSAEKFSPFLIGEKHEHLRSISSMDLLGENSNKAVTGSKGGTIKVWDIGSGDLLSIHTLHNAHTDSITGVATDLINPEIFATCSLDRSARLWDYRKPRPATGIYNEHNFQFTTLAWHNQLAYLGDYDGKIHAVDPRKPNQFMSTLNVFNAPIKKIVFHGDKMVTIGLSPIVRAFRVPKFEKIYEDASDEHLVRDIAPAASSGQFYTVGFNAKLRKHSMNV